MAPTEEEQREHTLQELEGWLEKPMLVLGAVWLVLLVLELTRGIGRVLEAVGTAIWIAFLLDFALRLALAPKKGAYLRRNWLTVVSLAIPALRTLRIFRAVRLLRASGAVRGLRLVRVVGSLNRGMKTLGATMARRGFGYVMGSTLIVTFVGAAGMYAFERDVQGGELDDYGAALWWTAMIMTTMGSEYWPRSPEGRVLCLLLALYAFAVFGYVTATLATFFIGQDRATGAATDADALREEVAALRRELGATGTRPRADPPTR